MSYASDKKPGELTALTSLATDDVFVVGDASDASEVAKGITKANLITDLNASLTPALATTVTTNANLTGHITSVGNATSLGSFTKAQLTSAVSDGDPLYVGDISGISDGDKGDITVSASGATWTIDNGAVTLAKQADMATASVVYRRTIGVGAPEVQTIGTLKTDLGLTGTNSGDQTSIVGITGTKAQFSTAVSDGDILYVGDVTSNATHTGDVTGATALTIADAAVTLAKMANLAQDQFIGRTTASTGVPQTATITSAARTVLDDTTVGDMVNTIGGATATGTGGLVRIAGSTLTGTTTLDRLDYDRAIGLVNAIGNLGATETIDWSTHTHYTGTLDSNIMFTFSNPVSGEVKTLYLSYDSTAQRTITWPTVTWLDNATGAAPATPAASGKVLVVTCVYIGTTYYMSATGNYAVY